MSDILELPVLYAGWGGAWELFNGGLARAKVNSQGLHLDTSGAIDYDVDGCGLQEYDYAWPVFGFMSVVGLSLIGNALPPRRDLQIS